MSEITKDFIKFVAEVLILMVVLAVVFGEEGIASNTFYYLMYVEPILLQNWLTSTLSIGSNSPGEFMSSTETTGQAYTIKIYTNESGTTFVQVIPPGEYYLQAKFATIRPTPVISNCRVYDQEVKLKKGIKERITVKKVMNADGTCNLFVGAPVIEIPIDRYPHVAITEIKVTGPLPVTSPENPKNGDTFEVKMKYTHDMKSAGGLHLHWLESEAEFQSVVCSSCSWFHYDNLWNPAIMQGNELVEFGKSDVPMRDGQEITVTLRAKVDDVNLYYRAWDWSKDEHCRGDVFDHDREPLGGTCSENCDKFPDDLISCNTFKKTV